MALQDGTPTSTQPSAPKQPLPGLSNTPQAPSGSIDVGTTSPAVAGQASQQGGPSGGTSPAQLQAQQMTAMFNELFGGLMGPSQGQQQMQNGIDLGQLANIGATDALGQQMLNQNFGNQQQLLGLQGSDLAIQQGGLARQEGALGRQQSLLPQLEAITQQGFGTQQKGIDLSQWLATFNAGNQRTAQLGSAAASGATNTPGNTQQLKNIQDMLGYQRREIGLQQEGLGQTEKREGLSYGEQQAQLKDQQGALADQQKTLGNQAKRLGISQNQLNQQLSNGLAQLGLDKQVSLGQLAQAISDRQAGNFNQLGSVLDQVAQAAGLPALGVGG